MRNILAGSFGGARYLHGNYFADGQASSAQSIHSKRACCTIEISAAATGTATLPVDCISRNFGLPSSVGMHTRRWFVGEQRIGVKHRFRDAQHACEVSIECTTKASGSLSFPLYGMTGVDNIVLEIRSQQPNVCRVHLQSKCTSTRTPNL